MTPTQIAKDSESSHQKAFFAYCAYARLNGFQAADLWVQNFDVFEDIKEEVDALAWIHAIPNGGSRGDTKKSRMIRGAQLKAEGVKEGVPDVFLPYPIDMWKGLYLEFKKPALKPKREGSKGGLSDKQIEFKEYCHSVGYGFVVVYGWKEAVEVLKMYLNWKK